MRVLNHIITKTRRDLIKSKQNLLIIITLLLFCTLSLGIGFMKYKENKSQVDEYRKEVRQQWENRPAKHPHRMAHYGYLVFRMSHPVSIFDNGLDSYLGNVIFLEAHKQNTANLSEAGSTSVLVRFGSFTSAFILQCIVPLVILFLGFGLIVQERENAILKLLSVQGASGRAILWGKIIGLWQFSLLFLLPIFPLIMIVVLFSDFSIWQDSLLRLVSILVAYALYYFFICCVTITISARSKNSSFALTSLIGCWLMMIIFLPKGIQFIGQNIYPTPSRIAFETELEKDILQIGDSHNPDDPYFKNIKDSLLSHYKVSDVNELPINYSGFVMKEGERISSTIYNKHQNALQQMYHKQLLLVDISSFINPLIAVKNFSMLASGTDFFAYEEFQKQAEEYRYVLAQKMNDLQIEHISNIKPDKGGLPAIISQDNWKSLPDFNYKYALFTKGIATEWIPIVAILFWSVFCIVIVEISSKNLKLV